MKPLGFAVSLRDSNETRKESVVSTRSRVGLLTETDQVKSIYVHFDGYVEEPGVGAKLHKHWRNTGRVAELLDLGDLSQLGEILGQEHDFDAHDSSTNWCLAYGRDRGETDVDAVIHGVDEWPDYGQEYEYLFDPRSGSWSYRKAWPERGPWTPLS